MTLKEVIERVARRQGASMILVEGFLQTALDEIVLELLQGGSVQLRGLGTLQWKSVQGSHRKGFQRADVPPGWKLSFTPARRFRVRRTTMSEDEGMSKYGVELDDEKIKEASERPGSEDHCQTCGRKLDDARACPVHGTEPLEPTGR